MNFFKKYLITFVIFIIIDGIWLATIASKLFANEVGFIMADNPIWLSAALFYLIIAFGILYFVVDPALEIASLERVIISGALFGVVTYSTYDLTNLAVIEGWTLRVTVIDLLWGTLLCMLVSALSYYIIRYFKLG